MQPHWEHYYWDEHPPPGPRYPWLRDVILASLIGVALGASVGFRLRNGYWPFGATIAVTLLVIHVAVVGIAQLTEMTRQPRRDLARIAIAGLATTAISGVVVFAIS